MKTKSLLVTVAVLLIACQPKKETDIPLAEMDLTLSAALEGGMAEAAYDSPSPAYAPAPPPLALVKFVDPVIKDDAVEESAESKTTSQALTKNKKIIKDGSFH